MAKQKAFLPGEPVQVQRNPAAAWEPAEYRGKITDWPGYHNVILKGHRYINSMNGEVTSEDDPQAYRTHHLILPTRRIRKPE